MSRIYGLKVLRISTITTALILVLGCFAVSKAVAQNPSFTTINFPGAGLTNANAVNKSGDIVGIYRSPTATGPVRGFLLSGGQFTTIHVPGAARTRAFGINDAGDVVGDYLLAGVNYGFLLRAGSSSFNTIQFTFGTFSSPNTDSWGIDDNGNVTGGFVDPTGKTKAYVWQDGVFTKILTAPFPDTTVTYTHGMNAKGEIVGCYWQGTVPFVGAMHSLRLMPNGSFVTEDFPDGLGMSMLWRISESSIMVGHYTDIGNVTHGYISKNGGFEPIDYPGAVLTQARGIAEVARGIAEVKDEDGDEVEDINSKGFGRWRGQLLIVGFYIDRSGSTHGYLFKRRDRIRSGQDL